MAEDKKTKIKRKRWVHVVAPDLFRQESVGEIPVVEPKSLVGRVVSVNLMNLTRDIKKQNVSLKLSITGIRGGKAVTDFYGYYLNASSIKRLVRRGKEKIGLSLVCRTSDNKKIRIMPLIIPYHKVKGSIAANYRNSVKNYLISYVSKNTLSNIIRDLITNGLQRDIKSSLKKIYPVRILEIAKVHFEVDKKPVEANVEVTEEVKEEDTESKEEDKPKESAKVEEKPKEEKPEE